MRKRLRILLDEVAERVRRALGTGNMGRKLQVVRTASEHSFPTADIDEMLRQIERGYLDTSEVTRIAP